MEMCLIPAFHIIDIVLSFEGSKFSIMWSTSTGMTRLQCKNILKKNILMVIKAVTVTQKRMAIGLKFAC
jgi:hypothetical protein